MNKIVIIGLSSTAKTIYSFIEKYHLFEVVGFAVDKEYRKEELFCGLPVFCIEDLESIINKKHDYLFVAIQWNNLNGDRRMVFEKLKKGGYQFANLISPTAIINGSVSGKNCWIADLAVLDFGAEIQDDVFIKVSSLVGPNTQIGSHCFIGAKSTIGGGSVIGEQSFIGLGAIVFDEVKVGKKCIVGAATSLKRNLDDFSVYKSTTDSFIIKKYDEDTIESKLQFRKNVRS